MVFPFAKYPSSLYLVLFNIGHGGGGGAGGVLKRRNKEDKISSLPNTFDDDFSGQR